MVINFTKKTIKWQKTNRIINFIKSTCVIAGLLQCRLEIWHAHFDLFVCSNLLLISIYFKLIYFWKHNQFTCEILLKFLKSSLNNKSLDTLMAKYRIKYINCLATLRGISKYRGEYTIEYQYLVTYFTWEVWDLCACLE